MICPECNHENQQGTKLCARCGAVLTAPSAHRTNQVWNTEIEREQNQANSRTAMIALSAAVVLLIALIAAVCLMLPSMGDSLMGEQESGQSFIELIDEFLEFVADTTLDLHEPVPEAYAAIPSGADEEFIDLFEEFLEKAYDDDYADLPRLSERYYEEFADIKNEPFTNGDLAVCAAQTVQALDKIRKGSILTEEPEDPSVTHTILWMEGCTELYSVAETLYEDYRILYYDKHIPEYYIWLLPIAQAELDAEYDLTAQLNNPAVSYTEGDPVPYLTYTNNTIYELELTIYNDYYIGADFYNDESYIPYVMPGETVVIPLPEMPAKYEDHYTYWYIEDIYIDGINIYDYYW